MPKVSIEATAFTGTEASAGQLKIDFSLPTVKPIFKSTQEWSPGNWYDNGAAWRDDLGSPDGVGGTPVGNAGGGGIFNSRYGFTFEGDGLSTAAYVPAGNSLAIRLNSVSSNSLQAFNYSSTANRWDTVLGATGSQVLWDGTMWHTYFVLPADAVAGTYTATYEIFLADLEFTKPSPTGAVQYDITAQTASKNANFSSAFVTYEWTVVPEPSVGLLLGTMLGTLVLRRRR